MSGDHWAAGGTDQDPLVAVVGLPAPPDWAIRPAVRFPTSQSQTVSIIWAEAQEALVAALEQIGKSDRLMVLLLPTCLAEVQQPTAETSVIALDGKEQAALVAHALFGAVLSPGMIAVDIADIAPLMAGRRFRLAGSWRAESWGAASGLLDRCEIPSGAAYLVTITMPAHMTLSELDSLFSQIGSRLPSSAAMLPAAPFTEGNVIAITCLVSDS